MKKNLLAIVLALGLSLGVAGCTSINQEGLAVPSKSQVLENANTKVYFENTTKIGVDESLKLIKKYLENNKIIPFRIFSKIDGESYKYALANNKLAISEFGYSTTNSEGINLSHSVNKDNKEIKASFVIKNNFIEIDKKFETKIDAFIEFINVAFFLAKKFHDEPTLVANLGASNFFYLDEEYLNRTGIVRFTTLSNILDASEQIVKQLKLSGYQLVDNPQDANKEIYYNMTGAFTSNQSRELRNSQGTSFNTNVASTAMKVASLKNSSSASVGIGLGASLGLGIINILTSNPYEHKSINNIVILDKNENEKIVASEVDSATNGNKNLIELKSNVAMKINWALEGRLAFTNRKVKDLN